MKKLLFIALFSVCFFASSQAQLESNFVNYTADQKWDFGMNHGGTGGDLIVSGIQPDGISVAGTTIDPFALPMNMVATDNDGCFGTATVSAVGSGTISVGCSSTVTYDLRFDAGTNTYTLDVEFK